MISLPFKPEQSGVASAFTWVPSLRSHLSAAVAGKRIGASQLALLQVRDQHPVKSGDMKAQPLGQPFTQPGPYQTQAAPRNGLAHTVHFCKQLPMFVTMLVIAGKTSFSHQGLLDSEMVFTVVLQPSEHVGEPAVRSGYRGLQQDGHFTVQSVEGCIAERKRERRDRRFHSLRGDWRVGVGR